MKRIESFTNRKEEQTHGIHMGKIDGRFQVVYEHWIYIELPFPLKENMSYKLKLDQLAELSNEVEFTFNTFEMHSLQYMSISWVLFRNLKRNSHIFKLDGRYGRI